MKCQHLINQKLLREKADRWKRTHTQKECLQKVKMWTNRFEHARTLKSLNRSTTIIWWVTWHLAANHWINWMPDSTYFTDGEYWTCHNSKHDYGYFIFDCLFFPHGIRKKQTKNKIAIFCGANFSPYNSENCETIGGKLYITKSYTDISL